jgi:hypothetical protein
MKFSIVKNNFKKNIEIFCKCPELENVFCPFAITVNNLAIVNTHVTRQVEVACRLITLKILYDDLELRKLFSNCDPWSKKLILKISRIPVFSELP